MAAYITRGDALNLRLTIKTADDEPLEITGGSFETTFPGANGLPVVIANGQHTIIESGVTNVGVVDVALSSAVTQRLPVGKQVPFHIKVTLSGSPVHYWGFLSEIRAPLSA